MEQTGLVQHLGEIPAVLRGGHGAVHQEVGDIHEADFMDQFLDAVAAVLEDALFAVNEGDVTGAGGCVDQARVQGDESRLLAEG